MKKRHRAGWQLGSSSQDQVHLPHPGCSNLRLYYCSEANIARSQNTTHHHGLSPLDAPGFLTASPSGGGGHAPCHPQLQVENWSEAPPSSSRSGQLGGVLSKARTIMGWNSTVHVTVSPWGSYLNGPVMVSDSGNRRWSIVREYLAICWMIKGVFHEFSQDLLVPHSQPRQR